MCSYDIKSLFTNIPVREVIEICANTLYEDDDIVKPPFPRNVFVKFLEFATCGVEFSFNNMMYKQVGGLGMGGKLGSILANIYVGYLEHQIFSTVQNYHPILYKRYVDDTFALFRRKTDKLEFFNQLNSISCLVFTTEDEKDSTLPFLDVLVNRRKDHFLTSVYR